MIEDTGLSMSAMYLQV